MSSWWGWGNHSSFCSWLQRLPHFLITLREVDEKKGTESGRLWEGGVCSLAMCAIRALSRAAKVEEDPHKLALKMGGGGLLERVGL